MAAPECILLFQVASRVIISISTPKVNGMQRGTSSRPSEAEEGTTARCPLKAQKKVGNKRPPSTIGKS